MIKKLGMLGISGLVSLLLTQVSSAEPVVESKAEARVDYSSHEKGVAFIDMMVKKHQFDAKYIASILQQAEKKQSILDAISRPAEKTMEWHKYRNIFLKKDRIQQGVEFWLQNLTTLEDVFERYGVAPEVIVAIIGVETRYGRYMGSYRVIDALTTLGFDYPSRGKFFTGQLEQFFLLAKEQNQDPLVLTGSYAGAMGFGQFIPSSYRSFARDFDKDGFADIWNNKADAIESVANYFKAHGWHTAGPVMSEVKVTSGVDNVVFNSRKRPSSMVSELSEKGIVTDASVDKTMKAVPLKYQGVNGPEYWVGFNNFYVITRYNHSHLYAKAVWDLSQAILAEKLTTEVVTK